MSRHPRLISWQEFYSRIHVLVAVANRVHHGFTIRDAFRLAGRSPMSMRDWERAGTYGPTADYLGDFADTFGLTLQDFTGPLDQFTERALHVVQESIPSSVAAPTRAG